jgi:hypothetical protein
MGDKVNSGIRLSYLHARLYTWLWRASTKTLYAGVDFIPQSGIYEFGLDLPSVEGDGEEGEYAGGHRHQGGEVVHDAVGQPKVPSPATKKGLLLVHGCPVMHL